ncbi:hypothetical protein C900_03984 [Fulvivirga imtechensis AK7]|uniref:Secretion system C-terminal sorting domain-containing protein n=1 Tax=Fulvivirga imtechensis AK7 TaxID=1237149 RepID=L8JS49_9BACT|nr:T9SS type A sorting domain-containing protein [Fulvivirga imtechensis]ELR70299.1 hypothetical protein C900_03984 [Fulvivirga imtechensis AK7]
MKIYLLSILLTVITVLGSNSLFAQSGEVNRFSNESLEARVNDVKLFPNPTVEHLNVRIDNSRLSEASFTVHNIIGNIVETNVEKVGENEYKIKVKDLAPGYYLLAIRDEKGYFKETYKFLKR